MYDLRPDSLWKKLLSTDLPLKTDLTVWIRGLIKVFVVSIKYTLLSQTVHRRLIKLYGYELMSVVAVSLMRTADTNCRLKTGALISSLIIVYAVSLTKTLLSQTVHRIRRLSSVFDVSQTKTLLSRSDQSSLSAWWRHNCYRPSIKYWLNCADTSDQSLCCQPEKDSAVTDRPSKTDLIVQIRCLTRVFAVSLRRTLLSQTVHWRLIQLRGHKVWSVFSVSLRMTAFTGRPSKTDPTLQIRDKIRVFSVSFKYTLLSQPAQWRLIRLYGYEVWSESSQSA